LGLAAGVFLGCIVLCEIILRLNGYGNLEIYQPDRVLYWKLKPNQDCFTKVDHKSVHINSHSTRGPDFETAKPANTLRILSLGDSRTFGWGVSDVETYSERLRSLLENAMGGKEKVEVINAGVNAWSYPQILVYFRDIALEYHPDVVILADANFWTQFSEKNSPEFVEKFMNRVRLKNFLRHFAIYHYVIEVKLKDFYERHREKFIPVDPGKDTLFKEQQREDPNAVFRSAIQGICQLARSNHIQPVLIFLPTLADFVSPNAPSILNVKTEVSKSMNVPLLDLRSAFRPELNQLYLEGDPVHLNVRGNEIIATQLFEVLTNLVVHE
jgi:lysophospholipase L1-like esterase